MGEIANVIGGGTPSTTDPKNFEGSIPWITPADMSGYSGKTISGGSRCISEQGLEASGARWLPEGTVLFSSRAPIGYVAIASRPVTTNQGFKSFVPNVGLNSEYIYYWLTSAKRYAEELASGTTFLEISGAKAALIPFPLAPAAEQTRIVAKLEELLSDLDAGVAELKAAQKKLGQYRQSLLKAAVEGALTAEWRATQKALHPELVEGETGAQLLQRILTERRARWEAKQLAKAGFDSAQPAYDSAQPTAPLPERSRRERMPKSWQKKYPEPVQPDTSDLPELPQGWVWASVDQVGEVLSGFAFKSTDFCGDGIPVTKIANIGYGVYENGIEQEYLDPVFLKNAADFIISGGDILIALTRPITNGTLKSCLYPDNQSISLLNQRVAALKITSLELKDYFYLLTRTPYFREAVRTSTSETLQPNMSPNALKAISLPLPPIRETQELLSMATVLLDGIRLQEQSIEHSLKQSTAQRENLLRAAFAGELVPQDPRDEPASALLARIRLERAAQAAVKKPRGRKVKESA